RNKTICLADVKPNRLKRMVAQCFSAISPAAVRNGEDNPGPRDSGASRLNLAQEAKPKRNSDSFPSSSIACSGSAAKLPNPGVYISNYGMLPLPIRGKHLTTPSPKDYPAHLAELVEHFEVAPYGHGATTVVDTSFRLTYQLSPVPPSKERKTSAADTGRPQDTSQKGFFLVNEEAFAEGVSQLV
ncbi:unnamed protein product, partial [Amoebophrya sp. A120]